MKSQILLAALVTSLIIPSASAQSGTPAPQPGPPVRSVQPMAAINEPSKLTKFNLDFPGGTPKQLVAAIEKALGRPLNVIIPDQHADTRLPALKMTEVNAAELFGALQASSLKSEAVTTGTYYGGGMRTSPSYQVVNTAYGFRSQGMLSDDTIWYFFVEKPALPPLSPLKACRFYSLAPYLEGGRSVDDITTAIQTGWKMLGDKDTPAISFHKDTKLLIAVGEPGKLETIDAVLQVLPTRATPAADRPKAESAPKPATKPSALTEPKSDPHAEN